VTHVVVVAGASVVGEEVVGEEVVGAAVVGGAALVEAVMADAGSVFGAVDVSEPLHAMRPQPAITTTRPLRTSEECVMRRTIKF
jgi:hypothetical protein